MLLSLLFNMHHPCSNSLHVQNTRAAAKKRAAAKTPPWNFYGDDEATM
jgi:hypothetical protein